jgi:hypothetical protein
MVKLNLRTKSIGTRASEDEYAHLERVAQKASKTLAESCREVMLNSANGGATDTAVAGAPRPRRLWPKWWHFVFRDARLPKTHVGAAPDANWTRKLASSLR